jgi:hypothetical protein
LGIRCFLQNISLLIVEGVGGCYNADSVTSVQQLLVAPSTSSLSPNLDRLKLGKEQEQESETEIESGDVFTFEVGEEAALMEQSSGEETGAVSGTPSRNSVKVRLTLVFQFRFTFVNPRTFSVFIGHRRLSSSRHPRARRMHCIASER